MHGQSWTETIQKKKKTLYSLVRPWLAPVPWNSQVVLPRSKATEVFSMQMLTVSRWEAVDEEACFAIGLWKPSAPEKDDFWVEDAGKSCLNFLYPRMPPLSSMTWFVAAFVFK